MPTAILIKSLISTAMLTVSEVYAKLNVLAGSCDIMSITNFYFAFLKNAQISHYHLNAWHFGKGLGNMFKTKSI